MESKLKVKQDVVIRYSAVDKSRLQRDSLFNLVSREWNHDYNRQLSV